MSRKKFVLVFLACGFALHFATRILLNQAPDVILLAAYWSVLALGIHYLLSRRRSDA